MLKTTLCLFASIAALGLASAHADPAATTAKPVTIGLPIHTGGRVVADGSDFIHQWPGVYFEGRFKGTAVTVMFNDGINRYDIYIDGQKVDTENKPGVGDVDLGPLPDGDHVIRLEKLSESQGDSAAGFDGFFVPEAKGDVLPSAPAPRARRIEFIGDSYTVGYGNISPKRTCTQDEIWATTDTQLGFGALTAKHYNADYQINAVSGRGMVRNYNGGIPGTSLPATYYPYALFDGKTLYKGYDWQPQIIVIGLGTNDFSTPLNPGEKWATRDALHADYEATYVKFVQGLRAKNPNAFFILMATDQVQGEIQAEVQKVMATLQSGGETRIAFLPMNNLSFGGCDWHPTTADDVTVEGVLTSYIDAHPDLWQGK